MQLTLAKSLPLVSFTPETIYPSPILGRYNLVVFIEPFTIKLLLIVPPLNFKNVLFAFSVFRYAESD